MTILPLELQDIVLSAGERRLLDSVTLKIAGSGRLIILGPNGAGKSLLLRLCHGLLGPDEGLVRWRGPDGPQARHRQAMVFQRPVMLRRSVRANLDYPLRLRRVPVGQRRELVDAALSLAGLQAQAEQSATTLSSGEQQRLSLVRAQALQPEVMFLDEPTASLDPSATGLIEQMIQQIHETGVKIVMTTHDLGQARRMADEVIFLHNGRVVENSDADVFFDGPSTDEGRAYLDGRLLW
jgi:tungstate transport system ATP-binding protein